MKKLGLIVMLSLVLSACGGTGQKNEGQQYKYSNTSAKDKNHLTQQNMGDFGYSRHSSGDKAYTENGTPKINRQRVANMISDLVLQLPKIKDVGTLVTDEEVLIGYKTTNKDRMYAADQVKMAAFSVVPRYYHVYVSDENGIIDKIEKYRTVDNHNSEEEAVINTLINQMKRAPQGKKWNYGENPNGEMNGENNMMRSNMTGK